MLLIADITKCSSSACRFEQQLPCSWKPAFFKCRLDGDGQPRLRFASRCTRHFFMHETGVRILNSLH
jgi:hypothetical protein